MIFYLTYNDALSGIFRSQVIDVVNFLNGEFKASVRLVVFASIRNFNKEKSKIKSYLPNAIVVPMFPKVKNWKWNILTLRILCLLYKPNKIIGRSVLATSMALNIKKSNPGLKVVYDGRGAIAAEWKEYNVVKDEFLISNIHKWESEVVNKSDFCLAVSNKLVEHWRNEFGYNKNNYVVIPCTLEKSFREQDLSEGNSIRQELGIKNDDVFYIYSGSVAGWQSMELMTSFFKIILSNKNAKVLFLSSKTEFIEDLQKQFPSQVKCMRVEFEKVPAYLSAGDYGILIREKTITNKVASPVKFAEYLSSGLKVIISEEIGDYSEFVISNNCGYLFNSIKSDLPPLNLSERERNKSLSNLFFKEYFKKEYSQLLLS